MLLCVVGILLLVQSAGAAVTLSNVGASLITNGRIGTAPAQNDLGGYFQIYSDNSAQPNLNKQDSAILILASPAGAGVVLTGIAVKMIAPCGRRGHLVGNPPGGSVSCRNRHIIFV